ncbi:MAG TPA: carboxypeptidase-like regulatory domain-containing protein, partial [Bryobacteraceae bacterium]
MRMPLGVACCIRTSCRALVCAAAIWPSVGQITTGVVEGSAGGCDGRPRANAVVRVKRLPSGPDLIVAADSQGRFTLVLPYGDYQLTVSGGSRNRNALKRLHAGALRIVRCQLGMPETGACDEAVMGPWWLDFRSGAAYFGSYSVAGALLHREPTTVSQPLDFTGLAIGRRALLSQRAFSWTGTQYRLQGMDATDPYQPGFPVFRGDVQAADEVTVRGGLSLGTSQAFGLEAGTFLRESASADGGWHGGLSSENTGAPLASENLPSIATRNILQQSEQYNWYTRDSAEAGGPIGKRADVFLAGTGQWSSQTVPIVPHGRDQNSRLLFGNASGRVRLTAKDQIDALYSGSRISLSDWGQPAGLEALLARRMAPAYNDVH